MGNRYRAVGNPKQDQRMTRRQSLTGKGMESSH